MKRIPITVCSIVGCAWLLSAGGVSAQDAYSNAVVALKPAGYWPLQETALPPSSPVTTLTNYGTLGSAANGVLNGNVMGGKGPVTGGQSMAFDGLCTADGSFSRSPYLGSAGSPPLPFTIEAWVNTAYPIYNGPSGQKQTIILGDYSSPPDLNHRTGWVLFNDYNNNGASGYSKGDFYFKSYQNGTSTQNPHNFAIKGTVGNPTVQGGVWYHLVIVLTTSNAVSYVNGVAAGSQSGVVGANYVPNNGSSGASGLTVATRGANSTDNTLNWAGAVAEVAYYTNVMTLSDAQADYNARNDVAAYEALVAARHPVIWYKMDSLKQQPVAKNYGTFGTAADGYYPTDPTGGSQLLPGQTGPGYSGFGADTLGFQSGTGQIPTTGPGIPCGGGDPAMWNFSGSFTISAWAQNNAGPMGVSQQLVSQGNQSFRMYYDIDGLPKFKYFGTTAAGGAELPVGDWHFWTGVYDASAHTMALYIDGAQSGSTVSMPAPSTGLTASELLIGGTPFYAKQNWIGNIAHVAIFTNALSASQISALYNAAKGCQAPEVTTRIFPTAEATCWTNSTYVFRPVFHIYCGTPTYTWTLNSVPIAGATGATLAFQSIPGLAPGNSYGLAVTADNPPYGSASSYVTLNIETPPPVASTIYADAFSRSGVLDGSLPDQGDLYSALWSADGSFSCNGSLVVNNSPYAFAAWLPFVPQPGHIYVASCDLNPLNGDNNFLALGFATNQANGFDYIGRTTYVDARGNRAATPGGVVVVPGTGSGLSYLRPFDAAGPSTYQVVLDTTTDAANPTWRMSVYEDGIRQYEPERFSVNPNFTSVFLGNYMTGGGTFDNFKLTDSGVASGAPVMIQHPPAHLIAVQSFTASMPAAAAGATSYQWRFNGNNLVDNGRIIGSHTNRLTLLNVQPSDAGSYQLVALNGSGSVTSAPCVLTVGTPPVGFTGANESLWTTNIPTASMSASVPALVNNVLTLTDGIQGEAGTIFFNVPQYIGAFHAQFVYQVLNPVHNANADGVAFCLQNDPRGPAAVGTTINNSLGIRSLVAPSLELVLNLWSQNALVGYTWTANGSVALPAPKTPGSVRIDNGDPIAISLYYDGNTLSLKMTDNGPVATNSFSTTLATGDLTAALGSKTAYVGFGASDYNFPSTQIISNFTFVSLPTRPALSITATGNGGAKITWPGSFAGFQLQQKPEVAAGNWTSVTNAVSLNASGNCEVTVPAAAVANFYRLALGLQP